MKLRRFKYFNIITGIILIFSLIGIELCLERNNNDVNEVIRYYRKEKNKEKLSAARFLIANMKSSYSYNGKVYEEYRKVYNSLCKFSKSERDENLRRGVDSLSIYPGFEAVFDSDVLRADDLIKHIDFAYNVWKDSRWSQDVNFDTFCKYILPYKHRHEGISDYMESCNKKYSSYLESISFDGGMRHIAIEQDHATDAILRNRDGKGSLVKLTPNGKALKYDKIGCKTGGKKMLYVQYSNIRHWNSIQLIINTKDTIDAKLKPLDTLKHTSKLPLKIPIQLRKGNNTIELLAKHDTCGIEYIEIVPYEKYYKDNEYYKIVDGANYVIINAANNKCLEINSKDLLNEVLVCSNDYQEKKSQYFNIQNVDYGFFNIAPSCLTDRFNGLEIVNDFDTDNNAIVSAEFDQQSKQLWAIIPVGNNEYRIINKLNGECLTLSSEDNPVIGSEYACINSQHWFFKRVGDQINFDSTYHVPPNSALEATRRIAEELDFDWQNISLNLPEMPALDILRTKVGNCYGESQFQLYILRSLGIPAVIDFFPLGAASTVGHEFNSIIDKNGHAIYCQVNMTPGIGSLENPMSKVYRIDFSINHASLAITKDKNERVPSLFEDSHLVDVTSEYLPSTNVDVYLFKTSEDCHKHVYLCVNNNRWLPVSWSCIKKNKSSFKDMGYNMLYLPAYYTEPGNIEAAGYPFILYKNGVVKKIIASSDSTQTLILKRKFLWGGGQYDNRMNEGKFQGANNSDFSDAVTLYTFKGNTEPIFYNLPVESNKKYKYIRYCGADGTNSTLSELMFLDQAGCEIGGTPIGTPGSYMDAGNTFDKAFDKDILTFYEGASPNGTWIGMKFEKPEVVKTIRFIPRNDGNCIEIGDKYELEYWDNHKWKSLGQQTAKSDSLVFEDCPTDAIYILHNHTKGKEERIFTYEEGRQIFW